MFKNPLHEAQKWYIFKLTSSEFFLGSLWIKPSNNNLIQGTKNDKLQISTTLMQVIIIAAEFSEVSAAQLSYSIMLSDT